MRIITSAMVCGAVLGTGLLAASPSTAMGTDNAFDDLQVGVRYTVYEPTFTAGLALDGGIGGSCPAGEDENVDASYGSFDDAHLSLTEGRPICVETLGDGKTVAHVTVQGRRAAVEVFCDFGNAAQWRDCSPSDMADVGGAISVTLPGADGRRPTSIRLVNDGKSPLTYRQMLRVVRSLRPAGASG